MNLLDQLRKYSTIVSDTGNFDSIIKYKPVDATTNPSLIFSAVQDNKYPYLIEEALGFAKRKTSDKANQVHIAFDRLIVDFGIEILKIIPGRVSTELDARLSFDIDGSVRKARELVAMYYEAGIDRNRILIKLASTWEGIKAAEKLTSEGIHCNMTLLFSMPQAIASAEANVQLISPFVGRVLDWYKKNQPENAYSSATEPGVLLVKNIYNYFKKYGYKTEVMGASFRNTGEIIEIAGCDLMTISPQLLNDLEKTEGTIEQKLFPEKAVDSEMEKMTLDEKKFRWLLNEDAMATEKLAEGIRKFTEDIIKLETTLFKKLQEYENRILSVSK